MRFISQAQCKHNTTFVCMEAGGTYAFYCYHLCGFSLPFDPAKFPEGVSLGRPSPDVDWKQPEKLIPSLK